jgi:hypothetical protein
MNRTIHLHYKHTLVTIEINNKGPYWMLTSKLRSELLPVFQTGPQDSLGMRGFLPHFLCETEKLGLGLVVEGVLHKQLHVRGAKCSCL